MLMVIATGQKGFVQVLFQLGKKSLIWGLEYITFPLKKLGIKLPYDTTIPLPHVYPEENII